MKTRGLSKNSNNGGESSRGDDSLLMKFNKKSIALEENRRSQATLTVLDPNRDEPVGKMKLIRNPSGLKLPLNLKLKRKNSN